MIDIEGVPKSLWESSLDWENIGDEGNDCSEQKAETYSWTWEGIWCDKHGVIENPKTDSTVDSKGKDHTKSEAWNSVECGLETEKHDEIVASETKGSKHTEFVCLFFNVGNHEWVDEQNSKKEEDEDCTVKDIIQKVFKQEQPIKNLL